jgi:3-phenylpropionate/trans-cinnamate dioxygenase ferredoxin component
MTTWVPACQADDVETEDIIPFEHDGEEFAIYRSDDDEFFATDGFCTHEREKLCDGLVMGKSIECPKHNGRFDYTSGKAKGAPVIHDLRTYPVMVDDSGTVHIGIG